MGTVYSAYDLRLDRKVAIKVLASGESSQDREQRSQRLLREAQAMAKLSHPNVVPVYEVGVEQGDVFIAMEYVAGETLSAWRTRAKPSWRAIVDVFVEAARGLAAAHEAGIVHRDFKPANVLVDGRGHVRVVDFGIAQVRGMADTLPDPRVMPRQAALGDELTPPTPMTPLTELGSIVGTPAYMSPEQYASTDVDARSDQFSFCVALWEALFGKRPFEGRGKALAENIQQGTFRELDTSNVPSWVIAIVRRGLSADPAARFPSMTELADALARDPARRRRRIALAVAGALAIAGVATLAGTRLGASRDDTCEGADAHLAGVWDGDVRGRVERAFEATAVPYAASSAKRVEALLDGYREAWVDMRRDACRATRVRGEQTEHVLDLREACLDERLGELRALATLLAGTVDAKTVERSVVAASGLTPVIGCGDTGALLQPGSEPSDPVMRTRRLELQSRLDRLRADRRVARYKVALEPAKQLLADARAASDPHVIAPAVALVGELQLDAGDLAAAEVALAEAVRRARQLGDVDLLVTAAIDLVATLAESGISKSREALGMIRIVEAFVADAHDPVLAFRLAYEKADEEMVLAHPELARPILDDAVEHARRVLGPDHMMVLQLETLRANSLNHVGKSDEALAAYDAVIDHTTRVLGALHPTTLLAKLNHCRAFTDSEAFDKGAACYAAAMPDGIRVIGAHDRELISYRDYQGQTLLSLGKRDEARAIYAAALADVPPAAWTEQWFIASDVARTLGLLEVEAGDYPAGKAHCEQAEAAVEQKHAGPVGATCIAQALLGLGDAAGALALLEGSRARIEHMDPMQRDPAQVGMWHLAFARAVWAAKHDAAAARALALAAREDLADSPRRHDVDAFLATLH